MRITLSKEEVRVLKETFKGQIDMERDAQKYLPQESHEWLKANEMAWRSLRRKVNKHGKKTTARRSVR
jgi:hypothetical protein